MNRSELSKALLAGALAMAASSSAHARPSVSAFDSRELTFDDATAGSDPAFDLSSTSSVTAAKRSSATIRIRHRRSAGTSTGVSHEVAALLWVRCTTHACGVCTRRVRFAGLAIGGVTDQPRSRGWNT